VPAPNASVCHRTSAGARPGSQPAVKRCVVMPVPP
jgi:hypothetical protein